MSVDTNAEALQTPEAASAAGAAVPTPEPAPTPGTAAEWTVEGLPAGAQKMIHDLRAEAAANRTKATEATTQSQAKLDAVLSALGLKSADDPAEAAKTAAAQRDAALAEAKQVKVENAVLRAARKAGADPEALTDSRSFMKQLDAIDPAADDFSAQVEAAINKAVEVNPGLKPVTPPPRSGGPVGGGAPVAGQLSRDDLQTMSTDEINKAREEGRLNQLLGITSP